MRNDTILITQPGLDHLCSRVQSSVRQEHGASHGVGFRALELTRVHPYLQYLSESVMIPTFTRNGLLCFPFWTLARLCKPTGWLRKCISFFPVFETTMSANGCKNDEQGRLAKVMEESLANILG
jgi:hypothetical protein